jgi:hypothetical protein
MYAFTHLLWNPDTKLRPLEEEWATHVYGPAADATLDIFDFLKSAHRREAKRGLKGYIFQEFAGDARWISLDTLHRAQQLLAAARRRAAGNERVLSRINQLEKLAAHGSTHPIKR